MVDFPGIGRVIERSCDLDDADEAQPVQIPKKLDIEDPTTRYGFTTRSSLSTGRDLSGRCLSEETNVSPGRVSPDEAQLICKSVLSELLAGTGVLDPSASASSSSNPTRSCDNRGIERFGGYPSASRTAAANRPAATQQVAEAVVETPRDPNADVDDVDLARVKVTASDRGCICGKLEWHGGVHASKGPEKVAFTLIEIRQGYTVVGETVEGPKLLSSLCWKLQSVNGSMDCRPAWIRRGDMLLLEGAKWATKRLIQPLPPNLLAARKPSVEIAAPVTADKPSDMPAISSRSASAAPLPPELESPRFLRESTPAQVAKPSCTERLSPDAASAPRRSIDFDVVRVSSTPRSPAASGQGREATHTFSEASRDSQDRPLIPVLDLAALVGRRQETLHQAGQSQKPHLPCSQGCDFGWIECNMLPPGRTAQGKKDVCL